MLIAYSVVAVAFAALLAISARMKLVRAERSVEIIANIVGVPLSWFPWLATAELAGAFGLLIGIAWAPLGLAAAAGLIVYFVVACAGHIRVSDYANLPPAALGLVLGVAALALRLAA